MNFISIGKAIASKLLSSSHCSRLRPISLYPNAILHRNSLYRTSATGLYKKTTKQQPQNCSPEEPKSQDPAEQSSTLYSPLWSSSTIECPKEPSSSVSKDWPRPSEIPWQAKVANSVNLIGRLQLPVQLQISADGKYKASTILAQDEFESLRVPLIFEGDLAHIAAFHLKEKDRVYVDGQLSSDPHASYLHCKESQFQIVVRNVNFVEGSIPMKKSIENHKVLSSEKKATVKDERHWRDLLKNPKEWRDHRDNKLNGLVKPKYPDFTHKDGCTALWLNNAPKWILEGVVGLEFDVSSQKTKKADDVVWKDLVESPDKWWDNRSTKTNEKAPDFVHKESREALWLNSSPTWVLPKLRPLET